MTNLNDGKGVPLSANLDVILLRCRTEKTGVFKSATKPLKLPFYYRMSDEEEERPNPLYMMFKTGDDMR